MTRRNGIFRLREEQGIVGWLLVLIVLGVIFVIYLLLQLLGAIF